MMNKILPIRLFQIITIVTIALVVGYVSGTYKISTVWDGYKPIVDIRSQNPPSGQTLDMSLFFDVVDRINEDYYDKGKLDTQKMLYGAISGMLESLGDPYTSFFPPKENESFKTALAGEFQGIGAELSLNDDNQITVVSPLDGSPAKAAGIRSGDIILKVEDESTFGWTLSKAVDNIRGPKGTVVVLEVLHEGESDPVDIPITRDVIEIKSATGWIKRFNCSGNTCIEDTCPTCSSIGYVRLSQFGDKTNDEWLSTINSLFSNIQNEPNFKGLILDVRNNPGGYLNDAVYIVSEFLDGGTIVIQEDGDGKQDKMSVIRKGVLLDVPLVVLVNKGSASASEIVAGALRDYDRAILLGETTFGKGTIQQAIDVKGGGSVHVSVAKWLTPNGTWVNGEGLTPDIEVVYDASKSAELGDDLDNQIERAIRELVF